MSRAFVGDSGGWGFCEFQREECMFAENGRCTLKFCKQHNIALPEQPEAPVTPPPPMGRAPRRPPRQPERAPRPTRPGEK